MAQVPLTPLWQDAAPATSVLSDQQVHTTEHETNDSLRYNIFCVVWAIATLFHMAQSRLFANELHYALLTLAAVLLIAKPSSVLRLVLLIALQLYEVVARLPNITNHWIFTTFVNLTILQVLLYLVIKKRSIQVDRVVLIRTFAPLVKIELVLLYFFVVLHKLNWDFFSTSISCAAVLYKAQHIDGLFPASDTFLKLNIYSTILIETIIPLFLCFKKIRNFGLLIGLVFHCVIAFNSYNGFYDFSSMVFAIYFLFIDLDFNKAGNILMKLKNSIYNLIGKYTVQYSFNKFFVLVCILLSLLLGVKILSLVFDDYFRMFWAVYSAIFIAVFLFLINKKQINKSFAVPVKVNGLFLLIPALVFLNGVSPYLGLKTESSFAMFSNLRTEGGITNHFFIPISAQIFDYQQDMVEVTSSSDILLQKMADENKLMTFFHFKNYVAYAKPAQVDYVRAGKRHSFTLAASSPDNELLKKSPMLLRKLMLFRAISKSIAQPCQH